MTDLSSLNPWLNAEKSAPMPVLFLGHGSPMNAIEENQFVAAFRSESQLLPKPKAVLCVSAHWETLGTRVTAMPAPRTIHDFGGFPPALYQVQYPAPGDTQLASSLSETLAPTPVGQDQDWGLDHGAWSVLKHFFPEADVPVLQLSLDLRLSPLEHLDLAKRLAVLRERGVLVVGSGNLVHNLGQVAWSRLNEVGYGYDWAQEAQAWIAGRIADQDHKALANYASAGRALQLAIPTPEHYLPSLYTLALRGENESLRFFNDELMAGSLSMTSFRIG